MRSLFLRVIDHPLFYITTLAILQLKILWGSWYHWDLPTWDGAAYFARANQLVRHFDFPTLDLSPLYTAFYGVFHVIFSDPLDIYVFHRIVTLVGITVLMYVFLRLVLPEPIAWLMTTILIFSDANYSSFFVVHIFIIIVVCFIYIVLLKVKSVYSNYLALLLLIPLTFTRPEYVIAFPVGLVILTAYQYRKGELTSLSRNQRWVYWGLFIVFAGLSVIFTSMIFQASGRSLEAFGQHYAWGYQERNPEWQKDFWLNWREALEMSFGDAEGISQAFRNNSGEFLNHVFWNLRLLPAQLLDLFGGLFRIYMLPFLLGLMVAGWLVVKPNGRHVLKTGNARFWIILLLITGIPILSSLLIRPRQIYFPALQPTLLLLGGLILSYTLDINRLRNVIWLFFLIMVWLYPAPFADSVEQPVAEIINAVAAEEPDNPYGLYSALATTYCAYLNTGDDDCIPIPSYNFPGDEPLESIIVRENIQVIVFNNETRYNVPPPYQDYVNGLNDDTSWRVFTLSGDTVIYIR